MTSSNNASASNGYILHKETLQLLNECEIYVCRVPRSMKRELQLVCPNIPYFRNAKNANNKKNSSNELLALVVIQHTKYDMIDDKNKIANERNACLRTFNAIADEFSKYVSCVSPLCFVDMIDPMTGQNVFYQPSGPSIYDEIDGGSRMLGFKTNSIAKCAALTHPKWGTHMYPATIFTDCPISHIKQYLSKKIKQKSNVVDHKQNVEAIIIQNK